MGTPLPGAAAATVALSVMGIPSVWDPATEGVETTTAALLASSVAEPEPALWLRSPPYAAVPP